MDILLLLSFIYFSISKETIVGYLPYMHTIPTPSTYSNHIPSSNKLQYRIETNLSRENKTNTTRNHVENVENVLFCFASPPLIAVCNFIFNSSQSWLIIIAFSSISILCL